MTPKQLIKARSLLGLNKTQMATALGFKSRTMYYLMVTGKQPISEQTALAVECLLRRENKLEQFEDG